MITDGEARRLDRNAAALGVPVEELMANAGAALAAAVARASKGGPAVFLCGKGHNGGDGLAAAADMLRMGLDARVVLAEPPATLAPACRPFLARIPPGRTRVWAGARDAGGHSNASVYVDCLLGTGARGAPRPPYGEMLRWLAARRRAGARIVACDVPSAHGTRHAVPAHQTVTFHDRKPGMTSRLCGRVSVAPIGIPDAAMGIGPGDLDVAYARPRHDSHKGDNGVVALVAGGPYRGAPWYAGMSAYRTGADLVHAFLPAEAARVVEGWGPEILVHSVEPGTVLTEDGVRAALPLLRRATAVVVGPGLGRDPRTRAAAALAIEAAGRRRIPMVVDADGLDALTPELMARHGERMVLTPHAREFRDLAGRDASEANVHAFARRHGVTVVRKSHRTFVSDGERSRACERGHPTLTVGGTGDVLAGAAAELLAKGAPSFEGACAAVYLVARAGELAARERSYGATAHDVLERIPAVLLEM